MQFAASLLFVFMPRHKLEVQLEKEHKAHLERATFSFQEVKNKIPQRRRRKKKNGGENESHFLGCDAAEWCESFDRGALRPNWCIRAYLLIYQANDSSGKRHHLPPSS